MTTNHAAALAARRWKKKSERTKQAAQARELNESLRGTPTARARAIKAANARHARKK